nr:uncharacterized protein LOC128698308 [Cherax quadricarinatus]
MNRDVCFFTYSLAGCENVWVGTQSPLGDTTVPGTHQRDAGVPDAPDNGNREVRGGTLEAAAFTIKERPLDTANSYVDVNVTLHHQGETVLALSGVTTSGRQQCVMVVYVDLSEESEAIMLGDLPLPHGTYNTTISTSRTTVSCLGVINIGHRRRLLPNTRSYPWNEARSRNRRVGGTDLGQVVEEPSGTNIGQPVKNWYSTMQGRPMMSWGRLDQFQTVMNWSRTTPVQPVRNWSRTTPVEPVRIWSRTTPIQPVNNWSRTTPGQPVRNWSRTTPVQPVRNWGRINPIQLVTSQYRTNPVHPVTSRGRADPDQPAPRKGRRDLDQPLEDIVLGADDSVSDGSRCPCCSCYDHNHTYFNDSALLQFAYTVNDTCDNSCYDVNLKLYKIVDAHNGSECTSYHRHDIFHPITRQPRNISESPVYYHNVGIGCYFYEMRPNVYPLPINSAPFWLHPPNQRHRHEHLEHHLLPRTQPRISMEPYCFSFLHSRNLHVKWTEKPVYNFSHYELEIWYSQSQRINCVGNTIGTPVTVIPRDKKLVLSSQPGYVFYNLSSGWYCARVTPRDDRCDFDGCQPRSSHTKLLTDPKETSVPPPAPSIVPVVVGSAVAVVLAGIVLACCVLKRCPVIGGLSVAYSKVNQMVKLGEPQVALLAWSPYGPHGAEFVPIISAFKKILKSYSRCQVYDYLDLLSLPGEHLQHLLVSPTSWIDALLADTTVKIILVGNEGSKLRQAEGMLPAMDHKHTHFPGQSNPHDSMLFPYLLRRLQDSPHLAGDYSRIFHVRFSDVSDATAELDGIVSWTRYRLPEHLRKLTLSLHGRTEECNIDDPSSEMLQDLNNALAAHPQNRIQNGSSVTKSLLNSDQTSNGTTNYRHVQTATTDFT